MGEEDEGRDGGSVRYDTQGILAYEAPVGNSVCFPGPLNPENKLTSPVPQFEDRGKLRPIVLKLTY